MRFKMKITITAMLIFLVHVTNVFGNDLFSEMGVVKPNVRLEAPAFILNDLNGNAKSLKDFKGKVILLNFWATWCRPCREEMPAMERLWRRFKDKGFVIIAVAADRGSPDRIKAFCKTHDVTFTVLTDPAGEVRRRYEVPGLPTSYLIGKDGKFMGKVLGAREWGSVMSVDFIDSLISKDNPS